ncbi:MAG: class I SAM-dependent methyltransferase [Actinomycetota bacterium]|nr:class I SAM-dependent methyltransferase [Actinomycetota bacterium]
MASIDPEGAETTAIEALVDLSDKSILEIGCGDGRLTSRIARRAKSVLALDLLERDIAKARNALSRELRSRVKFVVADATTYRYPRARFDLAVLSYSL